MKYDLVEIRPVVDGQKWRVSFTPDDRDRTKIKTYPSPLGFFHYPRSIGKKRAFNKLKHVLVQAHREEIARLRKSLIALENLNNQ